MPKARRFEWLVVVVVTLVAGAGVLVPSWRSSAHSLGVQARPADALVESIGVNTHLHYSGSVYKQIDDVERVLLESGIRHIRDYPVNMTAIARLAQRGVRTSAIIGHPDQGNWGLPLDTYFGNIMKAPQAFSAIEGTNEPDITMGTDWPSKMQTHQRAIWDRVKGNTALKHVPVAGPSITWGKNAPALGDISSAADWGNVHPYPGARTPDKRVGEDVTASKQYNVANKPVVATETGYHTAVQSTGAHKPITEAAEGIYMPRLWLGYFALGVPRTFTYELVDQGTDKTLQGKNFGLLRNDFSPKPAYTATKNLIALLADPGPVFEPGRLDYTLEGSNAATRQLLLQKRDGTFWLAVWQETSVWDEVNKVTLNPPDVPLTLRLAAPADVGTYVPNSGTSALTTSLGTNSVPVLGSEQVTLLKIRGSSSTTTTTAAPTTTTTAAPTTTTTAAPTTTTTAAPTTTSTEPSATTAPQATTTNLLKPMPALIDGASSGTDHRWLRRSSGSTTGAPAVTTASGQVLHGTASLIQKKNTSGAKHWDAWQSTVGGGSGVPVASGKTYTFRGELRLPDASSKVQAIIEWFDASGRLIRGKTATGTATQVGTTGSTVVTVTGTAPAGAVEARLINRVASIAAGNRVIGDRFSFHVGTGTGFPTG